MANTTVNPYTNLKMWLRYEMLDIDAIIEAIDRRSAIEKIKKELLKKLDDEQKQSNKIKDGKMTFSTFYKNTSEKASTLEEVRAKIKKLTRESDIYTRLDQIIVLQLNQAAIQFFKERKLLLYYKAMKLFS